MFCLAKENEENGEQEADNEVDEEEEEGGEEEDEEEEGDGNFVCSPPPPSSHGSVLLWIPGSRDAEASGEQHLPLAAAARELPPARLAPSLLARATNAGSEVSLESLPAG